MSSPTSIRHRQLTLAYYSRVHSFVHHSSELRYNSTGAGIPDQKKKKKKQTWNDKIRRYMSRLGLHFLKDVTSVEFKCTLCLLGCQMISIEGDLGLCCCIPCYMCNVCRALLTPFVCWFCIFKLIVITLQICGRQTHWRWFSSFKQRSIITCECFALQLSSENYILYGIVHGNFKCVVLKKHLANTCRLLLSMSSSSFYFVLKYVLAMLHRYLSIPRREAGDVWCLPPVWNLRAVIWFHFAISSLVLLPSPVTLSVLSFSACWPFLLNFFQKILQYFSLRDRLFCMAPV